MNPENSDAQPRLRLDDESLQLYASRYTDARTREPVVWLGRYIRNKCNGSIEALVSKSKTLQIQTSYATIHKILTGKYFNTKEAQANGSVPNFIQLVNALKKRDSLESMAGRVPFIETPTYRKISSYIDSKCAPERICKFGIIIGHTG